jgi:hypothetical protein
MFYLELVRSTACRAFPGVCRGSGKNGKLPGDPLPEQGLR